MTDLDTVSAQSAHAPTPSPTGRPTRRPFSGARVLLIGIPHVFVVVWAILVAAPLLWVPMSSFKSNSEIYQHPFGLPGALRLGTYADAWREANIGRFFLNSVIVVSGGVTLTQAAGSTTST